VLPYNVADSAIKTILETDRAEHRIKICHANAEFDVRTT
jgi:hypothetical protein